MSHRRYLWFVGFVGVLVVAAIVLYISSVARQQSMFIRKTMDTFGNFDAIQIALDQYHDDHECFPPAYLVDAEGVPAHSWRVLLLPYLGHQELYERYDFEEPWDGPNNRLLVKEMPKEYGGSNSNVTEYLAVVDQAGFWPHHESSSEDTIEDARTIVIVEVTNGGVRWMAPRDLMTDELVSLLKGQGSEQVEANVLLCKLLSGGMRRLDRSIPEAALRAIVTSESRDNEDSELDRYVRP